MDLVSIHTFLRILRDDLRAPLDYEAVLERQYRAFLPPDGVVIDVGAHAGRHTRAFLDACPDGRVVAVEPIPDQAAFLREAFGDRITVVESALGDRGGTASFVWARGTPEESGLRRRAFNDPERAAPVEIDVTVTTLDAIAAGLERCDFVKLDVEGAELTALAGGRTLLARTRPVVSVEYGRPAYSAYGHSPVDLFAFASGNGFVVHDLFLNAVRTEAEWLSIVDIATWDFFLVPVEAVPLRLDRTRADRTSLPAPTDLSVGAAPTPETHTPKKKRGILARLLTGS